MMRARPRLAALLLVPMLLAGAVVLVGSTSSTADAVAASGNFECDGPDGRAWAEVAGAPNSYVTGNCADGWHVHRTIHSDAPNTSAGWEVGEVLGDYRGCGVVKANESHKVGEGTYSVCTEAVTQDPHSYISFINCRSGQPGNCPTDPDLHGARDTQVLHPCQAYANVRPFSANGSIPTNPVQTISPGDDFRWRYLTKDGTFVLGFHSGAPKPNPIWVFVPADCVTTPHAVTLP